MCPEAKIVELPVTLQLSRWRFRASGEAWRELRVEWLRSRGINPITNWSEVFTHVKILYPEIQDLEVNAALALLERRLQELDRNIIVVGVSVHRTIVTVAGPLVLLALMLYFVGCLRVMRLTERNKTDHDEFWSAQSDSAILFMLAILSIVVLPPLAVFLVPIVLSKVWWTWLLVVATAAVSGWSAHELMTLRTFLIERSVRAGEFDSRTCCATSKRTTRSGRDAPHQHRRHLCAASLQPQNEHVNNGPVCPASLHMAQSHGTC